MARHDVVVVGAGLAGMSAALDLKAGGADVLVLEPATGPVGGLCRRRCPTDASCSSAAR